MRSIASMGHPFRLGRLFGIDFRIDPSWLFIFVLVSWSLTSLFAGWHPDWTLPTSIAVAVGASLVFFASVLFHELAHAAVARLYGIPVRHITLHLFGGIANIEKEPPSPGAEFFMAVVGPIASIGLGILMIVLTSLAINLRLTDVEAAEIVLADLGPVSTALVWLGPVNIMVGIFNLIPGFPLDGGRILRAIVWRVTGSLSKATRAAGLVGEAAGWLFVITGVVMALGFQVPFFGRGLTSGLWLALIGLFLRNAAKMHLRGAALDEALVGIHVADLMRTQGPVVSADLTLRELIEGWFMRHDEPAYPVMDGEAFVGLVTVEDVRKANAGDAYGTRWQQRTVRDIMTPLARLVVAGPHDDIADALRKLGTSDVRQLPVVTDQGGLVGLLCEKDVARWLELRPTMAYGGGGAGPRVRHA
jgi:Zn-dependent protease/predicted transcriptional regulator